jgi:hypothetical protein
MYSLPLLKNCNRLLQFFRLIDLPQFKPEERS